MLVTVRKWKEFSFSGLMDLYQEDNLEAARELWPRESEHRQLELAEQEFCQYLQEVFFATPDAVYYIWQVQGKYVSALRLEPYRDGMLLEALVTHPGKRGKGYARQLVEAVLAATKTRPIYSHVGKSNGPSQRVHEACGFQKIMDYAVYADGSVSQNCETYWYEKGV